MFEYIQPDIMMAGTFAVNGYVSCLFEVKTSLWMPLGTLKRADDNDIEKFPNNR